MSGRSRDRDGEPPATGSFADALRGVRRLAGRDRVRPPPVTGDPRPRRPADAGPGRDAATPGAAYRLCIEHRNGDAEGRAEDVSRALLARLRAGRQPVDRELDLHGLSARRARRALYGAIDEARARGERRLLVIHGRGTRSGGRAVLKTSLPEWLAAPGCAPHVLAFSRAPDRLGGSGATLVWLRRTRAP